MALLMSGPLGRHIAYETFLSSHLLFAVVLTVMIWIHVYTLEKLTGILLIISAGSFALCLLHQVLHQCYRNIGLNPFNVTRIVQVEQATQATKDTNASSDVQKTHVQGCLMVKIRLPRPFPVHPGQYVYLTVLSWSRSSFQRHPFVVAWWTGQERASSDSRPLNGTSVQSSESLKKEKFSKNAQDIYLLIDQRRGWTSYIQRFAPTLVMQRAWLDGPYGLITDFHRYDCVLLFATGSGLFAVLPVIKRLIELIDNVAAYTQSMRLVWYTDRLYDLMGNWMDELLNTDAGKRVSADDWGQRMTRSTEVPDVTGYIRRTLSEEPSEVAIVGMMSI
ncbi:hypothetical protein LTR86_010980 [Recurvomyces mirabilis]|nr:hypothetical protein LTR86_010980 [Recurvomyces mirabilis]